MLRCGPLWSVVVFSRTGTVGYNCRLAQLSESEFKKFDNDENVVFEGVNFVQGSKKTIAWVLSRRGNSNTDIVAPTWSAFQQLTTRKPVLCEANVGYHPAIRDTPTKYGTIRTVLKTSEDIFKELELGYIFLEVDQAAYTKIIEVKLFLLHNNESAPCKDVIVRMGGFHVVMCLMRSIYSRFPLSSGW